MDHFKIKAESEEHSKEIQEWLFSKDIHWWPKTHSRVVEGCKEIYYGAIEGSISGNPWDVSYFEECPFPEKWFYDGQLQDSPKPKDKDKANTFRELMQAQLDGKTLQVNFFGKGWVDCTHTIDQVRVEDIGNPVRNYRIKPKPRICNGVELDECIKEPLRDGEEYYIAFPLDNNYNQKCIWDGCNFDLRHIDRGVAYIKEESAIKHAKAMLNIAD